MKKPDLKLGLIGSAGRGASLGTLAHRPGKGARIVACCDIAPHALDEARATYAHKGEAPFTTCDYRELIALAESGQLDAVIIATPDYLHETHAVAALERGLAVYLEKPMALTIEGCDRILATAKTHHARLYLGHNMRHMGFVRKMKSLIDEGVIGEVKACWCRHFVGHGGDFYFRDWHADRRYSNSLLLQKAAHDIDIIHWLCGGYTRLVNALGGLTLYGDLPARAPATKGPPPGIALRGMDFTTFPPTRQRGLNHHIDVEDLSSMQMQLSNGVYATYSQCHYTPDYWRSYTIIGSEGRLENFGNGGPGTVVRLWNKRSGYNAAGDTTYKIAKTRGSHGGADPLIIAEFLRYVREGGATDTSPLAARESIAAGCLATESLRNGGIPLKVPAPKPALARFFENGGM